MKARKDSEANSTFERWTFDSMLDFNRGGSGANGALTKTTAATAEPPCVFNSVDRYGSHGYESLAAGSITNKNSAYNQQMGIHLIE